jgi:hypothetical protein
VYDLRMPKTLVWLALLLAVNADAREARIGSWDKIADGREVAKPVLAVIGLRQQKITVYDSQGPVLQAPVSTGGRTYETPAGIFTVLQKNKDHVSNLYEDAEMPFMQRITWSGIALHAGALPGYRASHGCVRLRYDFAERLFDLTSVGTRVVIAPANVPAINVSHPLLDRLRQAGAHATAAEDIERARERATNALKEAAAPAEAAKKAATTARRTESAQAQLLNRLEAAARRAEAQKPGPAKVRADAQVEKLRAEATIKAADADSAAKPAQSARDMAIAAESRAREARLRAWPLSIMVSRKTQRVYVRQGFEPVLEMPVVINEPEKPVGTHAFYATESGPGVRGWLSVAVKGEANEVLDRIELPREVADKFASSTWLGSVLIVSDEAPYKETAAGTDFIVVLSDEPQGALKIRSPESRPLAQTSTMQQQIRAYRPPPQDHQFRHPLGFFP